MIKLADEYAKCIGFKNATAKHAKKMSLGENMVQTLEGGARGSQIMATHLLSFAHSNGQKPPAEYDGYVDSIANAFELRVSALWDMPDDDIEARDEVNAYGQRCGELSKFQGEYIDLLRKEALLPK